MITFNLLFLPPSGARGLLHMNILLLSAFLLGGCNTHEPIAMPIDNPDYSIIDGDTVKTVVFKDYKKLKDKDPNGKNYIVVGDTIVTYKEPKLHTPPTKDPDLSKLKNNDDPDLKGKPLRYVAIGGSLTAGVRDGGYFNEGIMTSYPNLIARQMKLQKFEQPLFDATDYNGFGRKTRTGFNPTGGPVPKFNEVKNNSGVEGFVETAGAYGNGKASNLTLKKHKNYKEIDNWAVPNLGIGTLSPSYKINDYDWDKNNKTNQSLLQRAAQDLDKSYTQHVFAKKFDFFTYEVGWEDIIGTVLGTDSRNIMGELSRLPNTNAAELLSRPTEYIDPDMGTNSQIKFLRRIVDNKIKYGVFLNLPNISKFPFLKIITQEKQQELLSIAQKSGFIFSSTPKGLDNDGLFLLPTSEIDSLFSPKVHITLKKGFNEKTPLSNSSAVGVRMLKDADALTKRYNQQTESFAKFFNCPIVDLNTIYDKILNNTYISDDGVRVESSLFFSTDGIYPTAFGQSIIANEIIKALNTHYKMEIPLISTREYLLK